MGGIFQIGKSNAKLIKKEDVTVNFSNVAGCQEAKKEIMEFVDFLQDATQFTKLGAKIPKGALVGTTMCCLFCYSFGCCCGTTVFYKIRNQLQEVATGTLKRVCDEMSSVNWDLGALLQRAS